MKVIGVKTLRERLPKSFIEMLNNIYTPKEIDTILVSYLKGRKSCFRINKLKGNKAMVLNEFKVNNIKYCGLNNVQDCYVFNKENEKKVEQLSCYLNGEIYLQNPSSVLAALIVEGNSGDKILDLCAAPGGKSLVIANSINNNGEIVSNEVNHIRFERLKSNIDNQGVTCARVLKEDGRTIFRHYLEYFNRIIIDAPCSGEGTINLKNTKTLKGLENNVSSYRKKQKELLDSAYKSLSKGGIMVYSTCTLNPIENEEVVDSFLKKHKDVMVMDITNLNVPFKSGILQYNGKSFEADLRKSIRIIPNDVMEGFFICKMRKIP